MARSGFSDQIRFEGVREVTRAIATVDKDIARRIGAENREIGRDIIQRATPRPLAVGAGAGAEPRAIASRNMVAIQAGGGHRAKVVQQWGRRVVPRDEPRPFLVGALLDLAPDIERRYLEAIDRAARAVGLD